MISVRWGDYTKRIGIDGTAEAIKEAIKSTFGLRTKRAFWLEDEDNIVRALDRDMPLGNYTLHVDEGNVVEFKCMGTLWTVWILIASLLLFHAHPHLHPPLKDKNYKGRKQKGN